MMVRRAGQDDLAAVLDLHGDHGSRQPGPPTTLERETWQRMLETPELAVYLAVDESGFSLGTASAVSMLNVTYDCRPTLFIEAVVTRRAHRRQGVATAVLRRIVEDARLEGCEKIQVLSHKRHSQTGAHALYQALGFEAEAEGFRLYLSRT